MDQSGRSAGTAASRQRRVGLELVLLQLVPLFVVLLVHRAVDAAFHIEPDVVFHERAARAFLSGELPYIDFRFEYPPLALVPMVAGRLVDRLLPGDDYALGFFLVNASLSTLSAVSLGHVASRWFSDREATPVLTRYALAVGALSLILPWRYDLFPAALTAFAVVALAHDRPGASALCLGLGAAAKLYPLVLAPVFGAYVLVARGRRAAFRFGVVVVVVAVVAILPLLVIDPAATLAFLRYHQERPLELETVAAGLVSLARVAGVSQADKLDAALSVNVVNPWTDTILAVLPFLTAGLLALLFTSSLLRFRQEAQHGRIEPATFVAYCAAVVLVFLITAKVLSPQFIVWLLPFAPLLSRTQALLFVAAAALTVLVYPITFGDLASFEPYAVLLLNARNALLVAVLVSVVRDTLPLFKRPRRSTARSPGVGEGSC